MTTCVNKDMNTKVLFLGISVLLCACSDYDDHTDLTLEGKWTLSAAACYCAFGENTDFSGHKLNFNANWLRVVNTGEIKFLIDAEGLFYSNGTTITFANGKRYNYRIQEDVLELTFVDEPSIADDELVLTYRRGIPCCGKPPTETRVFP